MPRFPLRWPWFVAALIVPGLMALAALKLAVIDADIMRYLPTDDPVLADGAALFTRHPIQEQIMLDLSMNADGSVPDTDALIAAAGVVERRMAESGLFRKNEMTAVRSLFPGLGTYIAERLPVLFSAKDLEWTVAPRLTPDAVERRLDEMIQSASGLEGMGQAGLWRHDPLGFYEPVMARMAGLAPAGGIRMERGNPLSSDGRHLLMVARPRTAGADTVAARELAAFFDTISRELPAVRITALGAFRAALDNETIARQDVQLAMILATLGIAALLLAAFPRPLIGLLAFLPALFGTAVAFLVLALWGKPISLMALGFGGALISIAVDHGIAYLLFLDRPEETRGRDAAREIRSVGFAATLTTVGAFGTLSFSGFPILTQVGMFAAVGISASFFFVHAWFPRIFPVMPPAGRDRQPLDSLTRRWINRNPIPAGILPVAALTLALAFRPGFLTDLGAMNTLRPETRADERRMTEVWGDAAFRQIHVLVTASTPAGLQAAADRLLDQAETDMAAGVLSGGFVPSALYPGPELRERRLAAWRAFWTPERIGSLRETFDRAASSRGLSVRAFAPFFRILTTPDPVPATEVPEEFYPLFGIRQLTDGFSLALRLTPGPSHDPAAFYERWQAAGALVFDPGYFSERLGLLLSHAFRNMVLFVGMGVAVMVFLFFLDLRLTAAALLPVVTALAATLGILGIMEHPLDIPGLMLGIVVLGMGIDYSLYFIRGWQRYGSADHPRFGLIRVTVFMAGASTLAGFGALCVADHVLLRSAGIVSSLGIGFALAGAFVILPPVLARIFREDPEPGATEATSDAPPPTELGRRVRRRYRNLEPHPRLFARCKMALDPMFRELDDILSRTGKAPAAILDVGCGFGVPGCWLLERWPGATLTGLDPDPERVRVANRVWREHGAALALAAPHLPPGPERVDLALMLDMAHFLDDEGLTLTLADLRRRLSPDGFLVTRMVIPPAGKGSRSWRFDQWKQRVMGATTYHREEERWTDILTTAGFTVTYRALSGDNPESLWLVARPGAVSQPSSSR